MKEIEERINKDLEQVKDTLTRMNFVTAVAEQAIQDIGVTNYRTFWREKVRR